MARKKAVKNVEEVAPEAAPVKDLMAKAVSIGVTKEELLAAISEGIAMGQAMASRQNPVAAAAPASGRGVVYEICPECRQYKTACKSKHRKVVALPINKRWAVAYRGYQLNGVRYLSTAYNHRVVIPAECDFEANRDAWEDNEDQVANGRSLPEHFSGVVSPTATQFNAANVPGLRQVGT